MLFRSLRREVTGQNVDVVVVQPGVLRTAMFSGQIAQTEQLSERMTEEERRLYGPLHEAYRRTVARAASGATSPDLCAAAIEACIDARRPKARVRVGLDAKVVLRLAELLSDRMLDRVFRLLYRTAPPGRAS